MLFKAGRNPKCQKNIEKGKRKRKSRKNEPRLREKKIQVALKSISFFSLVNEDGYSI